VAAADEVEDVVVAGTVAVDGTMDEVAAAVETAAVVGAEAEERDPTSITCATSSRR
jgi:hypothetical protein